MTEINTNDVYGRRVESPNWNKVARTAYGKQSHAGAVEQAKQQSAVDRVELSQQYIEMQTTNSVTYDFEDFS